MALIFVLTLASLKLVGIPLCILAKYLFILSNHILRALKPNKFEKLALAKITTTGGIGLDIAPKTFSPEATTGPPSS